MDNELVFLIDDLQTEEEYLDYLLRQGEQVAEEDGTLFIPSVP